MPDAGRPTVAPGEADRARSGASVSSTAPGARRTVSGLGAAIAARARGLTAGPSLPDLTWDAAWPPLILTGAILALAVAILGIEGPIRAVATLAFAVVCPGMAIVRLLKLDDRVAELALGLSVSIALAGIVGGLLLYYGLWAPEGGIGVLVAITLGALVAGRLLPEGGLVHAPERRDLPELLAVARRGWLGGGGPRRATRAESRSPAVDAAPERTAASTAPATDTAPAKAAIRPVRTSPARAAAASATPLPRGPAARPRSRALDELVEPRDES